MNEKKEKPPQDRNGEIERLKYSYDRAMDIFRLHNDNYFKRVQIIMVALQAGLFIVIIKPLTPIPVLQKELILPIIVTLLGVAIAWIWRVLMTRQMQYMMLLKKYIQNLEAKFVKLKLPIDYFNIEAAISRGFPKNHFKTMTADIDDVEKLKEGDKHCNFAKFKWSKGECPENGKKSNGPNWFVRKGWLEASDSDIHKIGVPRGNMVLIEKRLSRGIQWFWLLGFIALLSWFFYC